MEFPFGHQLLPIYGPFAINSYGLFIALGVSVSIWLIRRNKRFAALNVNNSFDEIVFVGIIAGVVGGRALAIISEPSLYPSWIDWIAFWQGGFSILGTILGVALIVPLYLRKLHIPIIPACDLVAIYAPLMQAISRLGCFAAGCCHGTPTECAFGVIYTNTNTIANFNIAVHPTQLYSSFLLLCTFLFMFFIAQNRFKIPGQLFATYLMLASTERFIVDFWRADRIMSTAYLSFHQLMALAIFCCAALAHIILLVYNKKR
jgi:phosphatidylglycerol---prolipoprotein diacylglyceryl transferase